MKYELEFVKTYAELSELIVWYLRRFKLPMLERLYIYIYIYVCVCVCVCIFKGLFKMSLCQI